jgi:hypothetical protein
MPSLLDRALRPQAVLAVLVVVLVLGVLLTPARVPADPRPNLTTYSAEPGGAKGVHEVARRLGWRPTRRLTPLRGTLDTDAAYLVLAPPSDLTSSEVTALLDAVRRGAGLVFVPRDGSPLADSLGVERSERRFDELATFGATGPEPDEDEEDDERASPATRYTLAGAPLARGDTALVLAVRDSGRVRPVVAGFPLGRGRVVAVADPRLLVNDVLREGDNAMVAVRALEYAAPAPGARLVFAEYHFGHGERLGMAELAWRALAGTAPGRATLALVAAALLLLMAVGPRPIAPVERLRLERRSPLEHVGALARAYEQIAATRSTVRRLVRGLRRRHAPARPAGEPEERWLDAIRARHPGAAADIAIVERALREPLPPADLRAAGDALARIETLLTPHRART